LAKDFPEAKKKILWSSSAQAYLQIYIVGGTQPPQKGPAKGGISLKENEGLA
jgi:hypothetical protein